MQTSRQMDNCVRTLVFCNEASRLGALLALAYHDEHGHWPQDAPQLPWTNIRAQALNQLRKRIEHAAPDTPRSVFRCVSNAFEGAFFSSTFRGQLEVLTLLRDQERTVDTSDWPDDVLHDCACDRREKDESIRLLWRRN